MILYMLPVVRLLLLNRVVIALQIMRWQGSGYGNGFPIIHAFYYVTVQWYNLQYNETSENKTTR